MTTHLCHDCDFSADTHWKAFAAKKTVTSLVESVKSTQLSISDDRATGPYATDLSFHRTAILWPTSEWIVS